MHSFLKIADLTEQQVAHLRELEQALGVQLMAFEPGLHAASLSEEQLARVKALEKQLDVTILAFEQ